MIGKKLENKTVKAWIWMILAVIYTINPFDIVPDVPIIGWIDDFFIDCAAILNLAQHLMKHSNEVFGRILKILKRIFIIVAVILLILVFIAAVKKL